MNDAGACSASFELFPDSNTQHLYWALNEATGVAPLSYLWEWGDGNTDATAYPSHTYAVGGFYPICCTITDAMGCTNTVCHTMQLMRMAGTDQQNSIVYVNVVASLPVNIPQISDPEIRLYPNPTGGMFKISTEGFDVSSIEVMNAFGARVFSEKYSGNRKSVTSINLLDQPSGIYLAIITHASGVAVRKLIVN
jgi:hypothetical protein